ncbi:MAG: LysR family transcriptional regulator [Polyangiales bacterium]
MNAIHDRERLELPEQLAGVDLNLVVAFDALAREGSVTRAAQRLGITQSAMSHALRRLRELLGDPVLVRTGRGMVPTERAARLVTPVRGALVTLARALLSPNDFAPTTATRTFTLASPDLFDVLAVPPLLARLATEAPGVDVKIVGALGQTLAARLETGEIDVAVVPRFDEGKRGPRSPELPGLVRRQLFRDGFACFARADHPAFVPKRGHKRALSLELYLSLSHLLVSPSGDAVGPVDEALARRGKARRIALTVSQFTTAVAIVARSDLVLTAPAALAGALTPGMDVVVLAPPLPLPQHSISLAWHERLSSDPGHRWLRELLTEVARAVQR